MCILQIEMCIFFSPFLICLRFFLQVHRLIDMLKRNHEDSNSEASADASNADSGRGASEEEINLRNEEYNGDRGEYRAP